ncbi:MAG: hypothetical protein AAB337_02200 [Patescibacteria group bacterium]
MPITHRLTLPIVPYVQDPQGNSVVTGKGSHLTSDVTYGRI